MAFQTLEKRNEKKGPFSGQKRSEDQVISSWNLLHSLAAKQDTTVSKTGKLEQLDISDQLLYMKSLGADLGQKSSQLFWGLPSLHSESIVAALLVSRSSDQPENHLVLFNGVYKAPVVQMQDAGFPPPPQLHPFPFTFVSPPSFPHMEPESQTLPVFQIHSQAHMESPSFPPCRNTFHIPQNRPGLDILNGNQHLECHMLQKDESLCRLVPEWQQYPEAFYPSAPNFPLARESSQDYVPVSVIPDHFHFSNECQESLEYHEPDCRVLPQCSQACCSPGQLVVMEHRWQPAGPFPCALPHRVECVEHRGLSHKDRRMAECSQAGSFCEVSTRSHLRKDVAKNLGHILGRCSLNTPAMCSMVNCTRAEPGTRRGWECLSRTASGREPPSVSRRTLDKNEIKSILRSHVSRKLWQIAVGRIPIKVCCSWLADKHTEPPGNSCNNMEKKNLSPLLSKIYCHISSLELSFLDLKTQQLLETHIIRYRVSQRWGYPLKVLESMKLYMSREAKPWPFPQSDFPSSSVDLKTPFPQPLRESTKFFKEDKVGTTNSFSVTDPPCPATSSLGRSHSHGDHEATETVQKTKDSRQIFMYLADSGVHKVSQRNTVLEYKHSREQCRKQGVAVPELGDEMVRSTCAIEIRQGNQTVMKNSEPCSTSDICREILTAHELGVPPSEVDATSKLENFQKTNVNVSKIDTILALECDPARISVPKAPTLSEFKKQLFKELKLRLESQLQSQAKGSESDASLSLDGLAFDSSLSFSCIEDMALQELQAHLDGTGIFMKPRLEPWLCKWKCPDKNCTPAEGRLIPPGRQGGKGRNEDSDRETSRAIRRSDPAKKGKLNLEPSPPKSYFRQKLRQLFQRLYAPRASKASRSEKDRTLFMSCGPPEAHELMASLGKILEEKLACAQTLEWSQGKKDPQMRPEPLAGAASAPQCAKRSSPCFCH